MADWTQLPTDLLQLVSKFLETQTDILRFRSICTSWRSSVSPKPPRMLGTLQILPNDGISPTSFGFYLLKRTVFLIGSPNSGNQTDTDGWLVKIEEDVSGRKLILNPLSRYHLDSKPYNFPRVLDLFNFRVREVGQEFVLHHGNYKPIFSASGDAVNLYMEKVVMLCSDSENDYALLTIHVSGKLAMFKSGDEKWITIPDMPSPYDDVIVYKGKFYGVDNTGRMVAVGLDTEPDLVANPVFGGDKKYLVESEGELLLVDMYLSIETGIGSHDTSEDFFEYLVQYMSERTVRFKVFKLDAEGQSWIEQKSLGDRVLFLGDDSAFSASASELSGCNGNCIFFVDNFFYSREEYPSGGEDGLLAGRDIGVFELETGCIGPLRNYPEYSKMFQLPPHWTTSTSLEVQDENQSEQLSY